MPHDPNHSAWLIVVGGVFLLILSEALFGTLSDPAALAGLDGWAR